MERKKDIYAVIFFVFLLVVIGLLLLFIGKCEVKWMLQVSYLNIIFLSLFVFAELLDRIWGRKKLKKIIYYDLEALFNGLLLLSSIGVLVIIGAILIVFRDNYLYLENFYNYPLAYIFIVLILSLVVIGVYIGKDFGEYTPLSNSKKNKNRVGSKMNNEENDLIKNEFLPIKREMETLQKQYSGLQTIPDNFLEWDGYFKHAKKMKIVRKSGELIDQQKEYEEKVNELHKVYKNRMDVFVEAQQKKNEMLLAKEKENLIPLQMDVEQTRLRAEKSDHELKIALNQAEIVKLQNPKQTQPSIKEQKEEELWLAQIQSQIDNIKNRPPTPGVTDPVVRKLEKIKEYETKKEEMINEAKTEPQKSRTKKMFNNEIGRIMEGN
ncbi:hypothetical protein C0389_04765 [bacterium]|nr:hypothetical protein [bacterium]